ncbi:bet1-like SNARE 1-1 isoform X1 [Phalaenopsis equestris]|uniref:bet1-like SNARE 1-1 isoform X1 n=1 Tax=Phalaenopsis equestris TaxID=78828 RepID=UPI0009E2B285|nr:bet1-like SNARE 1-1 isoform X1 [Phalaenopsis equestris]XP_020580441.1 bet1-like SNARE 1-1 isoform X1 [Phalaenopsis equestris]
MNSRRDRRSSRAVLFDGIEEGGVRASYNAHEIDEHGNEKAIDGLQDRVNILKRLTGDIHGELETHNRLLDKMGHNMDDSRGTLYGSMDRFKKVFQTKSNRHMAALVASFIAFFFLIYYLIRYLSAI